MHSVKTPYIGDDIHHYTAVKRSAVYVKYIGASPTCLGVELHRHIRIDERAVAHGSIFVAPMIILPEHDSRRHLPYIIRLLSRIPESQVRHFRARLHDHERAIGIITVCIRLDHNYSTFRRACHVRTLPVATHSHSYRNDQLPFEKIFSGRQIYRASGDILTILSPIGTVGRINPSNASRIACN